MKKTSFILFVAAALASQANAIENPSKISAFVQSELKGKPQVSVIVVMKSTVDLEKKIERESKSLSSRTARIALVYKTLVEQANKTQAGMLKILDQHHAKYQRFYISNSVLVEKATPALIEELAKLDEVKKVVGNPAVKLNLPETDNLSFLAGGPGENQASVGADRVWNELKIYGQNITVAGQDTGVQWDHPALKNHYRGWNGQAASHNYNWHDSIHKGSSTGNKCGYDLAAPCDDDKHGTHTMGTVVGDDQAGHPTGMAPGAKWMACRNMDAGTGTPASYIECFQYFLAPYAYGTNPFIAGQPKFAPHVINNSWGCPSEEGCSGAEILPALQAMKAAGIMVVASAGNDGPGCSTIKDPPAYHTDFVLSVGAHDHRNGRIASFSSRGPSTFDHKMGPDVTAPGVSIYSSVPGNGYEQAMWSGTSMAGPHVVGQVALIWSANPKFIGRINETIALIRKTATPATTSESCGGVSGSSVPNNTYGYGRINAYDSVKAALSLR